MSEENRKLYPLRFIPESFEKSWGSQVYHIADLGPVDSKVSHGWLGGNSLSELMETYLERMSGPKSFDWYGTQFPLMVKELTVAGRTSVHVNPDDTVAADRYDTFGKTALWYILEAGDDAAIYLGFNRDISAGEYYERAGSATLGEVMNRLKVKAGDAVPIPPGQVHAAEGHLRILEISTPSELFFRVHDWGRGKDELHLEEAFDLVEFARFCPTLRRGGLLEDGDFFKVSEMEVKTDLRVSCEGESEFVIYYCVRGAAALVTGGDDPSRSTLAAGQAILVPSDVNTFDIVPQAPQTMLLTIEIKAVVKTDPLTEDKPWQTASE